MILFSVGYFFWHLFAFTDVQWHGKAKCPFWLFTDQHFVPVEYNLNESEVQMFCKSFTPITCFFTPGISCDLKIVIFIYLFI